MITVHLILNSHIDPVWLWPWQAGLDAVLNTCLSACDLIERHPDVTFTAGEAWKYSQIERIDPILFARIRRLVWAGRWCLVGGWWVQPDCNLPSGFGLRMQAELGMEYFQSRFGQRPRIGYNVDSFGHAASLPRILHEAGQDSYVMMRPQEAEMDLPARLFRWRGEPSGPEVVVFRIANGYTEATELSLEHVQASLTQLPPGVKHTMCFVGVGDHGGGPSERAIRWCREHELLGGDARLIFSSPERFFAAIRSHVSRLPLVCGELQHHAVGCYSVMRAIKCAVRRAEHRLEQARIVLEESDVPRRGAGAEPHTRLREAWKDVCFTHFHDTLAGSCVLSSYPQMLDLAGRATATADELIHTQLRRMIGRHGARHNEQQVILHNASDRPYNGYISYEPWLEKRQPWPKHWRVVDGRGRPVPYQLTPPEAAISDCLMTRLLLPARLRARQTTTYRIVTTAQADARRGEVRSASRCVEAPAWSRSNRIGNGRGTGMRTDLQWNWNRLRPAPLELHLIEDPSDTWSHELRSYAELPVDVAHWSEGRTGQCRGPLAASIVWDGHIGQRTLLRLQGMLYAGDPFVHLQLEVDWRERHRVLKMVVKAPFSIRRRMDGIPGGRLARKLDGVERPVRDFLLLEGTPGALGVVAPGVFAADATADRLRLTLLRSPLMAHHVPCQPDARPDAPVADRGTHCFGMQIVVGTTVPSSDLEDRAMAMHRPPILIESTAGMSR